MLRSLYLWVILAILSGVLIGLYDPTLAVSLKFLGDYFVSGVKILIGPLVFVTLVRGISGSSRKHSAARVGLKAFAYFEVVSTFALFLGLMVGNLFSPGSGFPLDAATLDPGAVAPFLNKGAGAWFDPRQGVNLIQLLCLAVGLGIVSLFLPEGPRLGITRGLDRLAAVLFRVLGFYMKLAPLGAGAAMAFTVGKFGLTSLKPLLGLMGYFYLTCLLFVFLVLGPILGGCGVSLMQFLRYLRSEIFLVLGTSSSESALAPLMQKLSRMGCKDSIVGLVVPAGYSMNLDGTNIYLTLGVLFLAQAFHVELSIGRQLAILGVAMVSSKGASGVTGAGFVTLAATLSSVPEIPVAGMGLLLGVDRFMSEARAVTNMIGNGVASIVVCRWEGEFDRGASDRELGGMA
jgi:aerobic C4-dicarboxylate transport protein